MQQQVENILLNRFRITRDTPLLLAISGGLDSVVLLHLLELGKFNYALAHVNYGLRGEESDGDEQFVHQLSVQYNRKLHVLHLNEKEIPSNLKKTKNEAEESAASFKDPEALNFANFPHEKGIQETARQIRYNWFESLLDEFYPGGKILTAHHADDSVETMLFNFFRGTGLAGLKGIPQKNGRILRPLLNFTKNELAEYAGLHLLNYRVDSSNLTDKYTRNYFRNQVIPMISKVMPGAGQQLYKNLQRFEQSYQLYEQSVIRHKKRLMEFRGLEVHIPARKLLLTEPLETMVFEIIRNYGFHSAQTNEVIDLCESETGKFIQSDTHRILKNRNWLIISPLENTGTTSAFTIEENDEVVSTSEADFHISVTDWKSHPGIKADADKIIINSESNIPGIKSSPDIAQLDAKHIKFPLIIRKWKAGDYFYPLGMKKKKKVARFLIDQKLSMTQKEKIYVIESDKKILWIAGQRIDDRYKITDSTTKVLKIKMIPKTSQ
jgi:tRNA(Ile)-lysidine synthase